MITHLSIKNFTIINQLSIDFSSGMTVLTGETGAGKSIIIDCMELVLGARANNKSIRKGCNRCDITAIFNCQNIAQAKEWLQSHELDSADECIIRRSISSDGRSRSTINGIPCPLQLTRELGSILLNIHGQHEHQNLLKRDKQRDMLDNYAQHNNLCAKVSQIFQQWRSATNELAQLNALTKNSDTALLNYQIQELEELNLQTNELDNLHNEYKQLNSSEQLIGNCNHAIELLSGNILIEAQHQLGLFKDINNQINSAYELINNAMIQSDEAIYELRNYLERTDLNPERLQQIESRLNKIGDIARKHRIKEQELSPLYIELTSKIEQINNTATHTKKLKQEIDKLAMNHRKAAQELTKSRKKAAIKLGKAVKSEIQKLNMKNAEMDINFAPLKDDEFSVHGMEQIEFLVATNQGQPLQSLSKIVSGGELSRISLAIQVITAQQDTTPTLIFDEVDIGIGGKTAQIVGQLLKQLGSSAQVLCVTHLPQVASQGNNHFAIIKKSDNDKTTVAITELTKESRINEIARMLGGVKITANTLAHAKELLSASQTRTK